MTAAERQSYARLLGVIRQLRPGDPRAVSVGLRLVNLNPRGSTITLHIASEKLGSFLFARALQNGQVFRIGQFRFSPAQLETFLVRNSLLVARLGSTNRRVQHSVPLMPQQQIDLALRVVAVLAINSDPQIQQAVETTSVPRILPTPTPTATPTPTPTPVPYGA